MRKRYEGGEYYTEGQVKCALEDEKLGTDYLNYALAMFLTQDDAIAAIGDTSTYHNIRDEVANKFYF